MKLARVASALLIAGVCATLARAQDFSSPAPAGVAGGPGAMLERSIPPADSKASLEFLSVRWSAAAEFATHAVAANAGWHHLVIAAGLSSSGDDQLGWNSAAFLLGLDAPPGGVALRVLARQERGVSRDRGAGLELGGGFRSAIAPRVMLWASAPSSLRAGAPPPLDRALELGIRWQGRQIAMWGAWSAPAHDINAGERSIGVGCEVDRLETWMEARENPLRGSIGVRASRGALELAAEIGEHPVLGESVRVALRVHGSAHEHGTSRASRTW